MAVKTIQELVDYIGNFGDRTAVQIKDGNSTDYQKINYIDLQRNAKSIAAYLQNELHIKKGQMVAVCAENRPEWFEAYLGITYNGIWAVPIDARLSGREIKNLILDCGTKVIFLSRSIYNTISGESELLSHFSEIILFDNDENILSENRKTKTLDSVLSEASGLKLKLKEVEEEDVASLIYTSGTTGKPKGVMLSHKNLIYQVNTLKDTVSIIAGDVELSVLPLHHTFEFSVELTILHQGATITYADSLKPNRLFANIRETNVNIMIVIPLLIEKIYDGIIRKIREIPTPVRQVIMTMLAIARGLNRMRGNIKAGVKMFGFLRKKADLHRIKMMISGAAPLNQKVAEGMGALGIPLLNGYGLTETSPVVSVNRLDKPTINESIGIVIEQTQVKIFNPDSEGNGEIMVKGPGVMLGYYRNQKATKEVIDPDGWFHTGDIGTLKSHYGYEYLYITGRSKNMIVTAGGKNVYPEEIEEMINNHPAVLESIVLGVPISKDNAGENIYAIIVPNYEYLDSLEKIQGFKNTPEHIEKIIGKHIREINNEMAAYKRIRGFQIREEEFPKTSTKKIKRFLFNGKEFMVNQS